MTTSMDRENQGLENQLNALVADLTGLKVVIDELFDDHATNKTTIDETRTAVIELIDDHATNIAAIADNQTQIDALVADVTALDTAFDTLVAKLNADAGVTDTDYAGAAAMTAVVTSAAPAATLTATDPTASAATLTATKYTLTAAAGT